MNDPVNIPISDNAWFALYALAAIALLIVTYLALRKRRIRKVEEESNARLNKRREEEQKTQAEQAQTLPITVEDLNRALEDAASDPNRKNLPSILDDIGGDLERIELTGKIAGPGPAPASAPARAEAKAAPSTPATSTPLPSSTQGGRRRCVCGSTHWKEVDVWEQKGEEMVFETWIFCAECPRKRP